MTNPYNPVRKWVSDLRKFFSLFHFNLCKNISPNLAYVCWISYSSGAGATPPDLLHCELHLNPSWFLERIWNLTVVFSHADFKQNVQAAPIRAVDIYNLMCWTLDVKPLPNNGSWSRVEYLLRSSGGLVQLGSCWTCCVGLLGSLLMFWAWSVWGTSLAAFKESDRTPKLLINCEMFWSHVCHRGRDPNATWLNFWVLSFHLLSCSGDPPGSFSFFLLFLSFERKLLIRITSEGLYW